MMSISKLKLFVIQINLLTLQYEINLKRGTFGYINNSPVCYHSSSTCASNGVIQAGLNFNNA